MLEKIKQVLGISKSSKDNFVRRNILIVDDNETDLALMRKIVEKIGHRVLTAANGKIGLETAKAKKPDLILSDCRMPQMSGVDMCKKLKGDEDTKNIPLVFLTNVDVPNTVVECFDLGVANYICKPIKPKILISQIQTIFNECFSS